MSIVVSAEEVKMSSNDICDTLTSLSTYQDVVNGIALKEMPVRKACLISRNSIKAWGVVMDEFNDVISTLEGVGGIENRAFRAGFIKALEIVMRANNYRKGNVR